jgi:hypothetical protein
MMSLVPLSRASSVAGCHSCTRMFLVAPHFVPTGVMTLTEQLPHLLKRPDSETQNM